MAHVNTIRSILGGLLKPAEQIREPSGKAIIPTKA
jgi:hypothetical protein